MHACLYACMYVCARAGACMHPASSPGMLHACAPLPPPLFCISIRASLPSERWKPHKGRGGRLWATAARLAFPAPLPLLWAKDSSALWSKKARVLPPGGATLQDYYFLKTPRFSPCLGNFRPFTSPPPPVALPGAWRGGWGGRAGGGHELQPPWRNPARGEGAAAAMMRGPPLPQRGGSG